MATPASGNAPYAFASDFLARCDIRSAAQLLSDDGVPLTAPQVLASSILTDLLAESSGEVESACLVGGRYMIDQSSTPPVNDLAALTGNAQRMLVGLVCTLTMMKLFLRRPDRAPPDYKPGEIASKRLESLEEGTAVFGTLEAQAAGVLGLTIDSPQVIEDRQSPVITGRPFFGRRNNQYPQQQN